MTPLQNINRILYDSVSYPSIIDETQIPQSQQWRESNSRNSSNFIAVAPNTLRVKNDRNCNSCLSGSGSTATTEQTDGSNANNGGTNTAEFRFLNGSSKSNVKRYLQDKQTLNMATKTAAMATANDENCGKDDGGDEIRAGMDDANSVEVARVSRVEPFLQVERKTRRPTITQNENTPAADRTRKNEKYAQSSAVDSINNNYSNNEQGSQALIENSRAKETERALLQETNKITSSLFIQTTPEALVDIQKSDIVTPGLFESQQTITNSEQKARPNDQLQQTKDIQHTVVTTADLSSESGKKSRKKIRRDFYMRKRDEYQCNFPENANEVMPPTGGGGGGGVVERAPANTAVAASQSITVDVTKPHAYTTTENLDRKGNGSSSINTNNHHNNALSIAQPTPLFERFETEEAQELRSYTRMIENQNRRLFEMEKSQGDLERRLEIESHGRIQLEATFEAREREWTAKFEELIATKEELTLRVKKEKEKNDKLWDKFQKNNQQISRMMQRKYDPDTNRSVRNVRNERGAESSNTKSTPPTSRSPEPRPQVETHKSPHEILTTGGSVKNARTRNIEGLLFDFFHL